MPRYRIPSLLVVVLALVMPLLAACSEDVALRLEYDPVFLPVSFAIDTNGSISISGRSSLITPIGSFAVDAGVSLSKDDDCLYVIFRDNKQGETGFDTVYKLDHPDDSLQVLLDGETALQFSQRQVLIDITKGSVREVKFVEGEQPIQEANGLDNILRHIPFGYQPFSLFKWMYDESGFSGGFIGIIVYLIRLVLAGILAIIDILLIVILGIGAAVHVQLGEMAKNIYLALAALGIVVFIFSSW